MLLKIIFAIFFSLPMLWALEYEEVRHLLSRTGFGGTPDEIDIFLAFSREEAVEKILEGMEAPVLSPPDWVLDDTRDVKKNKSIMQVMSEEQRKLYRQLTRQKQRTKGIQLKSWWYQQMIQSSSPFQEKMVLFWHNHFTSSIQKIKFPYLMYQQHVLFRKFAKGNLKEFTQSIAKDPAMIFYLDNQTNHKNKPNENFARELLELFTLGEGHYTENDIKEAARAFTGWMVNQDTGEYFFNKKRHDDGIKEFMGKQGNFNGEDIVDIVFSSPQVAVYIVTKMWKEFISSVPEQQEVERLADILRKNNYEIAPLLREMLLSPAFWNPKNYGNQIKSPVEFIVGAVRMFKIKVENNQQLVQYGKQLGQDIFDPPNVKGWPGDKLWITSNTLLARRQMIQRAIRGTDMFLKRFWVWHYMENKEVSAASWLTLNKQQKIDKIRQVLLPVTSVNDISNTDILVAIQTMVVDLGYQLK